MNRLSLPLAAILLVLALTTRFAALVIAAPLVLAAPSLLEALMRRIGGRRTE